MKTVRRFEFCASHHLPSHEGKCRGLHGHNYILEVEVEGPIQLKDGPEHGMVVDFGNLKKIVEKEIIEPFDHSDLNAYFENPTAEVMARDFLKILLKAWGTRVNWSAHATTISRVRLWETSNCYVEATKVDL